MLHLSYIIFIAYHHVKHTSFITCSDRRRGSDRDQVPEEENPPVVVGFDICGSLGEPNTSTNQGKPWSIQHFSLLFTNAIIN